MAISVVGLKHHSWKQALVDFRSVSWQKGIEGSIPGKAITLVPEPDNKYDPKAVAVYVGRHKIGFIPKNLSVEERHNLNFSSINKLMFNETVPWACLVLGVVKETPEQIEKDIVELNALLKEIEEEKI